MIDKELYKEVLKQCLMEGLNEPYNREDDQNVPKETDKRKPVLTLRKLNKLKKMRNAKLEELAQDSIYVPYLYGPPEQSQNDMGGGFDMGM